MTIDEKPSKPVQILVDLEHYKDLLWTAKICAEDLTQAIQERYDGKDLTPTLQRRRSAEIITLGLLLHLIRKSEEALS